MARWPCGPLSALLIYIYLYVLLLTRQQSCQLRSGNGPTWPPICLYSPAQAAQLCRCQLCACVNISCPLLCGPVSTHAASSFTGLCPHMWSPQLGAFVYMGCCHSYMGLCPHRLHDVPSSMGLCLNRLAPPLWECVCIWADATGTPCKP